MNFSDSNHLFFQSEYSLIQNLFIRDFITGASTLQLQVYLEGLSLSNQISDPNITSLQLASKYKVSEREIINAFRYWEGLGVLQVVSEVPLQVNYKKIDNVAKPIIKSNKYKTLAQDYSNATLGTALNPNELYRVIDFLETTNFNVEAFILMTSYLVNRSEKKDKSIHVNYILKIAKDWYDQGISSLKDVEEKIEKLNNSTTETRMILGELNIKREPNSDDRDYVELWLNKGFDMLAIKATIFNPNKAKNMDQLAKRLERMESLGIFKAQDIEKYYIEQKKLTKLTKEIATKLSLRLENATAFTEDYTSKWLSDGFDEATLILVASLTGKENKRRFDDINYKLKILKQKGLLTIDAVNIYYQNLNAENEKIANIKNILSFNSRVSDNERFDYIQWTQDWGFTYDLITAIANKIADAGYTWQLAWNRLNNLLSQLKLQGIFSIDKAILYVDSTKFSYNEIGSNNGYSSKAKSHGNELSEEALQKIINSKNNLWDYVNKE